MVGRLRTRLAEARLAIAAGDLEDDRGVWQHSEALRAAAHEKSDLAFRWLLNMARKEHGDPFADHLMQRLMASDQAEWVRAVLGEP